MVWGIRARITIVASLVVLAVLILTGVAVVQVQRSVLTESIDETLEQWTAEIAQAADAGVLSSPIAVRGDEDSFAVVLGADGAVVASTPGMVDAAIDGPPDAAPRFSTVRVGDEEYRVMSARHGSTLIAAGTPIDDVAEAGAALVRGLAVAIPIATLVLALLVWILVGRVLSPVEAIRREVAEISTRSLDRRVPEPALRDEVGRLARTMNEMLDRLQSATERQRRFVADASHELRTPLTRIRAELEVALSHAEPSDSAIMQSVRGEVVELTRLVDDLLVLARIDAAAQPAARGLVDLDDVVLREVERLRGDRSVSIDLSAVSGAQVVGDAAALGRAVRNLLDNAVVHGEGPVSIALREEDGEAFLAVADHGDGVDPRRAEQLFERFERADDARARSSGGTGLGLAIAREIVADHRGTVAFDPDYRGGARVVMRIPLAAPSPQVVVDGDERQRTGSA